jgi:hypothetical protein
LLSCSSVGAQSLAEVAKKEKERRAAEKATKEVRAIDDSDLAAFEGEEGGKPEPHPPVAFPPSRGGWQASSPPPENPNRRAREKKPSTAPAPPPTEGPSATKLPDNVPLYIEDPTLGEEQLRSLRQAARECRARQGASACGSYAARIAALEKALRDARNPRRAP